MLTDEYLQGDMMTYEDEYAEGGVPGTLPSLTSAVARIINTEYAVNTTRLTTKTTRCGINYLDMIFCSPSELGKLVRYTLALCVSWCSRSYAGF